MGDGLAQGAQEFLGNRTSLTTIVIMMSAIHVLLKSRKDKKSFPVVRDRRVRKNRSQEFFANRTSLTTIITTMSAIHVSLEARKDKKSFLILSDRRATSLILYLRKSEIEQIIFCESTRRNNAGRKQHFLRVPT